MRNLIAIILLAFCNILQAWDKESMVNLLAAQIASERDQPHTALYYYQKLLEHERSHNNAFSALEYAIQVGSKTDAERIAKTWAEIKPYKIEALTIALLLALEHDEKSSLIYLQRAIDIAPNDLDAHLVTIHAQLNDKERIILKQVLQQLTINTPSNPCPSYLLAYMHALDYELEDAAHYNQAALKLKADYTAALKLEAKIIKATSDSDAGALKFLQAQMQKFTDNDELRLFYAKALIDADETKKAYTELTKIKNKSPFYSEATMLLAKIDLAKSSFKSAEEHLKQVIANTNNNADNNTLKNEAFYYLGEVYEQENKLDAALDNFNNIENGVFYINANIRTAKIMQKLNQAQDALYLLQELEPESFEEQKLLLLTEMDLMLDLNQLDEALKLASDVLQVIPEDIEVLYARSLIATKLNNLNIAKADLNQILILDPNHANALNSLGFVLTKEQKNLDEAYSYLEKALKIEPDNPIFMDSMGWLLYKQGKLTESIALLHKAYNLQQNAEISVHLISALLGMGKKDDAVIILNAALKNYPQDLELQKLSAQFNNKDNFIHNLHAEN